MKKTNLDKSFTSIIKLDLLSFIVIQMWVGICLEYIVIEKTIHIRAINLHL